MILVLSCSLNPGSRSRVLAVAVRERLAEAGEVVEFVDLRETPLPMCDGGAAYGDPQAVRLAERGAAADAVLIAAPVYNYAVNAAAKNVVELTGRAWTGKPVGLLLAAGGSASYMAGLGLANSLMLDFRCLVVPRFVYAGPEAFTGDAITDPEIARRVAELAHETARLARALRNVGP